MKIFFKRSEKKPAVIVDDNFFSKNLPLPLYLFLNEHGLLDERSHFYQFENKSPGLPVSARIIVEKVCDRMPDTVAIRVETKVDDRYFHDLFMFTAKVWYMSKNDEQSGVVRGNVKAGGYCDDLFTDKQCVKKTPKEAEFIIDRLGKLIGPQVEPEKVKKTCVLV
jgi:hypothetical protein